MFCWPCLRPFYQTLAPPAIVFCEGKYIEFFQPAKTKSTFFRPASFNLQKIIHMIDALAIVVEHIQLHPALLIAKQDIIELGTVDGHIL
mgnify:CR=1 FL=1